MICERNKLHKVNSIYIQNSDKEKILIAARGEKHIHTLHAHIWEKQNAWIEFFPLLFKTMVNTEFYIQKILFQKKNGRLLVSSTVYNKNSTENKIK